MAKFRKKPVVIEAVQITDSTFDAPHPNPEHIPGIVYDPVERCVFIYTLEGAMRGDMGDWIITGVDGEHYPCKPDIFARTYEAADGVEVLPPGVEPSPEGFGKLDLTGIKRGAVRTACVGGRVERWSVSQDPLTQLQVAAVIHKRDEDASGVAPADGGQQ